MTATGSSWTGTPGRARRSVDFTGLVYQRRPGGTGEKVIGEVHRTKAGRFYVVMCGRRITATSLPSFREAAEIALAWEPDEDCRPVLADILGGAS